MGRLLVPCGSGRPARWGPRRWWCGRLAHATSYRSALRRRRGRRCARRSPRSTPNRRSRVRPICGIAWRPIGHALSCCCVRSTSLILPQHNWTPSCAGGHLRWEPSSCPRMRSSCVRNGANYPDESSPRTRAPPTSWRLARAWQTPNARCAPARGGEPALDVMAQRGAAAWRVKRVERRMVRRAAQRGGRHTA